MSGQGLARSVSLFRLFLREQADPGLFYRALAQDAVSQVAGYGETAGKTVVDVGGEVARPAADIHHRLPGRLPVAGDLAHGVPRQGAVE